jgi:hypothetical protein
MNVVKCTSMAILKFYPNFLNHKLPFLLTNVKGNLT